MHLRTLSVFLLSLLAVPAFAQPRVEGFAAQNHDPSWAGDRFFATPEASVEGHLRPAAKLTFNYAYGALRVLDANTGEPLADGELVRNQLYLHLDASVALFDRVRVGLGLPFAAAQSGDGAFIASGSVRSARLADMRLGARVNLLGKTDDLYSVGLQADLWLPTGSRENFAGDGAVRGHPRLVASGRVQGRYLYSAALGALLRDGRDVGIGKVGSALTYSAAAAALFLDGQLQVGPEISGSTAFADGESPVEALVGAHLCLPYQLVVGAGVGTALSRAPGAAAFRGLASLTWEPGRRCLGPDADGDEVSDAQDRCPHRAGPKPEGCPPDTDSDGIPDADDACAAEAGPANADRSRHGCPPDSDGDGVADARDSCPMTAGRAPDGCPLDSDADSVPDAEDACPEVAGLSEHRGCPPPDADGDSIADSHDACPDQPGTPELQGCPPPPPPAVDSDADGVADVEDACPEEAGGLSSDPKANGCPAKAELRKDAIEIRQQIQFALGTAIIEPASEETLETAAAILRERPAIRLSIEGHTDSSGPRELNLELSGLRAEAVRSWLVDKGSVAADRLSAVGFGPDKPVVSNDTLDERAKNRRVELRVVAR